MRWLMTMLMCVCCGVAGADVISKAQELGVSHLTLQELEPVRDDAGLALVSVVLDGRAVLLELRPDSVRSSKFQLVLDRGHGVTETVEPPAPKTVRGVILGEDDSLAAGSLINGRATLVVIREGEIWNVQPVEGEGAGVHAVYKNSDLIDHGGTCGVPTPSGGVQWINPPEHAGEPDVGTRGSGGFRLAEIAIDADWQLFSNFFGQNQGALVNDVESIIAAMRAIYERDVLLTYELTHVLIRTSSAANPYTTNNASTLLSQFQAEWNSNQQHVQRDVAHLFTGRNLSGSTIGIAFLGTICTTAAYGVDQIRFTTNFGSRVGLFSHELGHNWNAPHCDGAGECRIMCSGLGGCNGLGNPIRFAPVSINTINAFIPTRSCVDNIGTGLPIIEDFESGSISPLDWSSILGFDIVADGTAPSGVLVGRLTPVFALLGTTPIATEVASGSTIGVSLWVKPESTTSQNFTMTVTLPGGGQQTIGILPGGTTAYTKYTAQLPASVLNGTAQVRFAPSSSGPAWRFDDIEIFEATSSNGTISLPLVEDFETAGLFLERWQPSAAMVTTGQPPATSGSYSAAVRAGQRMETANVLGAGAGEIVFGAFVSSPSDAPGNAELVLQWRNSSGTWVEATRVPAGSIPSGSFSLVEVVLPAAAAHNSLRVSFEAVGGASDDPWRIDDFELGAESRDVNDCPADLAPPFGVLDLADINAFVVAFNSGDLIADLAPPFGVLDLADVGAFLAAFVAGCP